MPNEVRRRLALWCAAGLVLLAAMAVVLCSGPVRRWTGSVTGEENAWEAAKGTVALALLQLGGHRLSLAPDAVLKNVNVGQVGVNTFLQLEADPANVRRSFDAMKDAGVTWARQQFPWEDIEIHGKGDFEDRRNVPPRSAWAKYDRIVEEARAHGIQLLVRLDDPPDWAYSDPVASGSMGPPDDPEDYADFVAAVASRYCGRVRYYQLWNEPNIYPEWGERDVDPEGYAALLHLAAARLRQTCPGAVVVSAALAQTTEPGGRNMDDLAYLEALYQAGATTDFDVLAAQGFGLWTGPKDQRASPDRANFARVELVRDVMVRHGDAAKPIWITEMGWDSPPAGMAAPYGRVAEDVRARYTVEAYDRMSAEWPWAGVGFVWFLRRPNWEWHEQPQGYFRMLDPDWTATASWTALSERAARAPVLERGRHGVWDVTLRFSGPWRAIPDAGPVEARSGLASAELQFSFRGTGFQLIAAAPAAGAAAPALTVDLDGAGRPASIAPVSGDHAHLALDVRGLANDEHLAVVRIDSGELQVEEVRVAAPDPGNPLAPLWLVGGVAAGVAMAGAGLAAARRRRTA